MISLFKGFYEHIIYVHLHCFSDLFGEHTVDESLVSCASILKTERHHPVAVSAAVSYEYGFLLIVGVHYDLIVPGECVHERQKFVTSCRFDQAIDMWQWEAILWTCLIKIGEINAHSPLSVFLFDNDRVSEPVVIPNLRYGSDFEELFNLVVNRTSALWFQISSLLFDRFESRVDVELVTCDVDINPWHVLRGPCERVQFLFQTSYELEFQRLAQVRANFNTSIWEYFV